MLAERRCGSHSDHELKSLKDIQLDTIAVSTMDLLHKNFLFFLFICLFAYLGECNAEDDEDYDDNMSRTFHRFPTAPRERP
ncbi:hypothetical protein CEXT_646531, partial [Caerostris extrusa]